MINCWNKLAEKGYQRVGLALQDDIAARWSYQWDAAHLICFELFRSRGISQYCESVMVRVFKDWLSVPARGCRADIRAFDIIRQEGFRVPDDLIRFTRHKRRSGGSIWYRASA